MFACKRDNLIVFLLGLTCLFFSLLTWFAGKFNPLVVHRLCAYLSYLPNSTAYPVAPILLVTDSPALVLLTFSSSLLLLASMAGITGTLLNSRPILAVYVLLLFPSSFPSSLSAISPTKGEFFFRCKGQRSVAPLVLSQRSDCFTRSSRLLWLEWSTSRCCSVRHVLRPFSSSRLPRSPSAFRTGRSFLGRGFGIFSRAAPFGKHFGRSSLCEPRNAPFRKGYHTRALLTHNPGHIVIRGIGRSSSFF
jgi:hypothetical protein